MAKVSIATNSTPKWSLEQLVSAAAQVNAIDGIGVWREHFSEMQPTVARKLRGCNVLASIIPVNTPAGSTQR